MAIYTFNAKELYNSLITREDIAVLDVRNSKDFSRSQVESPYPFIMENISYFDFMEIENACIKKVREFAGERPIKVICAKEGSAKYVSEILASHGLPDVSYLEGGIKSWGNLLVPVQLHQSDSYQLYQFIRPGKASCSYGLIAGTSMQLFDPSRSVDFYLGFAKEKGVTITQTFETHLQADYIAGSRIIAEKTGADFLANEADFSGAKFSYTPLEDGKDYAASGGPELRAIFTPGHTPGSTSYLIDQRFLISGDTVFIQSVGRPDLGGQVKEWSDLLFDTLSKIKAMDQNLQILPGHYMAWSESKEIADGLAFIATLKEVIDYNSSIYAIDNKTDFLAFIEGNMRQQPEEYATIRKINAGLESVADDDAEILDLGKNECAASAGTK